MDDEIPEQGGSHASSSHEASSEPTPSRSVDLVNTVFILTSRRGPKLQGRRAGGARAKPYFEPQILVTC